MNAHYDNRKVQVVDLNEARTKTMLTVSSPAGEIEMVGPPELLIAENRQLRAALKAEQEARVALIHLVDEVFSEDYPHLRDSLMIRLGVDGLLAVPIDLRIDLRNDAFVGAIDQMEE